MKLSDSFDNNNDAPRSIEEFTKDIIDNWDQLFGPNESPDNDEFFLEKQDRVFSDIQRLLPNCKIKKRYLIGRLEGGIEEKWDYDFLYETIFKKIHLIALTQRFLIFNADEYEYQFEIEYKENLFFAKVGVVGDKYHFQIHLFNDIGYSIESISGFSPKNEVDRAGKILETKMTQVLLIHGLYYDNKIASA